MRKTLFAALAFILMMAGPAATQNQFYLGGAGHQPNASKLVFNAPFSGNPGDFISLTGVGVGNAQNQIFLQSGLNGGPIYQLAPASTPQSNNVIVRIPTNVLFNAYKVWIDGPDGASSPSYINMPVAQFYDAPRAVTLDATNAAYPDTVAGAPEAEVATGDIVRIFGRNLVLNHVVPTVTLTNGGTTLKGAVNMTASDAQSLTFTAPTLVSGTVYTVTVSNGYGTATALQNIVGRSATGTDYFSLGVTWGRDIPTTLYNCKTSSLIPNKCVGNGTTDDTANINTAITYINGQGGGILFLPAGTYFLASPSGSQTGIQMDANTVLQGAGQGQTIINYGTGTGSFTAVGFNGSFSGLVDLTMNNTDATGRAITDIYNQWTSPQSDLFLQRVTWNDPNNSGVISLYNCNKVAIENSTINNQSYTGQGNTIYDDGGANYVFRNNNIQIPVMSDESFSGINGIVVEGNTFTRNLGGGYTGSNFGRQMSFNWIKNGIVQNSSFLTAGGVMPWRNSDGETINSEGGGSGGQKGDTGTFTSLAGLALTGAPSNGTAFNYNIQAYENNGGYLVFVSGVDAGDWIPFSVLSGDVITLSRAPKITPHSADKFKIDVPSYENVILRNNNASGNPAGLVMYAPATFLDVLISGNTLTNNGGIVFAQHQSSGTDFGNPGPGYLFSTARNIEIRNNTLSDTTAQWGSYVAISFDGINHTAGIPYFYGVADDTIEVRNNIINADPFIPFNNINYTGADGFESYENYARVETPAAWTFTNEPQPITGTVFQGNQCNNCAQDYRTSYGAINTLIWNATDASHANVFTNVGLLGCSGLAGDTCSAPAQTGFVTGFDVANVAPSITLQPANQSVAAGVSATFTAAVAGTPAPTCQWQLGGTNISGATSCTSYSTGATTGSMNGNTYSLVATNSQGSITSNNAVLTVQASISFIGSALGFTNAAPGNVVVSVPTGVQNGDLMLANVTTESNVEPPVATGWTLVTSSIMGTTESSWLFSRIASSEPSSYTWTGLYYAEVITRVYRNAASIGAFASSNSTCNATLTCTIPALSYSPVPGAWYVGFWAGDSAADPITGPGALGNALADQSQRAMWSGDYLLTSGVTPPAQAASNSVADIWDAIGAALVPTNVTPSAPSISLQPSNETVSAPAAATFTFGVSGSPAPTCQWQLGGTNISGATSCTSYSTGATTIGMNGGVYSVVATNSQGSVTSNNATLTVNSGGGTNGLDSFGIPLTPSPGDGTAKTAVATYNFLSSIGINVVPGGDVNSRASVAQDIVMLNYTGMRWIRAASDDSNYVQVIQMAQGMVQNGAVVGKASYLLNNTGVTYSPSILTSNDIPAMQAMASAGVFLWMEGPNEPDNQPVTWNGVRSTTSDWTPVEDLQSNAYSLFKAATGLSTYPVVNLTHSGATANDVGVQFLTIPNPLPSGCCNGFAAGTKNADYAGEHNYVIWNGAATPVNNISWYNTSSVDSIAPEQLNFYGDYVVTWAHSFAGYTVAQAPSVPKISTEDGWPDTNCSTGTDCEGKIMMNTYIDGFIRGYQMSAWYQLIDSEGGFTNSFGIYTGASSDGVTNAKTAAFDMHNFTEILNDTTNVFTPGTLNWSATLPPYAHVLVTQKSNGHYFILIDDENWPAGTPDAFTFNLGATFSTVNVYDPTIGAGGVGTACGATCPIQSTHLSANAVALSMTDHPLIIEVY